MGVLDKIKLFFKRPKTTVKAEQPEVATKTVEAKSPEKTADETYQIGVVCLNCEYHGPAQILKGKLVSQTPCPRCGNKTLRPALPGEA